MPRLPTHKTTHDTTKSEVFLFRMPEQLAAEFRLALEEDGANISDTLRFFVQTYVREHKMTRAVRARARGGQAA